MATVNVLLFGETGVGKSSVINLIAGRQIAGVSPEARLCTLLPKPYRFPMDERVFNILDTPGLEVPETGDVGTSTIQGYLGLIQELAELGGVDLLLFCIRGGHITARTRSNYELVYEGLCRAQVPIALVITHLEREPDMNAWWTRNMSSLERCGIKASGHACVTGLLTHSKCRESQANVTQMLREYDSQARFFMPADSWTVEFLRSSGLFAPLKNLKKKELLKVLVKWYRLDQKIAEDFAMTLIEDSEPPKASLIEALHLSDRSGYYSRSQRRGNAANEGPSAVTDVRRERRAVAKPMRWARSLFPL